MDGSLLSLVLIVIVTTISLAVWLVLVYYADSHPRWVEAAQLADRQVPCGCADPPPLN